MRDRGEFLDTYTGRFMGSGASFTCLFAGPRKKTGAEADRCDAWRRKGVVTQKDGVIDSRLGPLPGVLGRDVECVVSVKGDRIDAGRDVEHLRMSSFGASRAMQQAVGAVLGAIEEMLVGGETDLAVRAETSRGDLRSA